MADEEAIENALIDEFDVREETPADAKRSKDLKPHVAAAASITGGSPLYPSFGDLPSMRQEVTSQANNAISSSSEPAPQCSQRLRHARVAQSELSSTAQELLVGTGSPLNTRQAPTKVGSEIRAVVLEMTDEEFEAQRWNIERELIASQTRMNHLAHALMGDTPHQVEERSRREHERAERQERRQHALELRVLHQLERAHEREERRITISRRASEASRSPFPEPHDSLD